MMTEKPVNEAAVLQRMISDLTPLDDGDRLRLLETVARFFDIEASLGKGRRTMPVGPIAAEPFSASGDNFSGVPSPKDFLLEKNPQTYVDRIACLAYYLTHYSDTPHFKTIDISKVNTEAAQSKFTNASDSVDKATNRGFLVPASKGHKQLSGMGEKYVQALPDRDAAKAILNRMRPRRRRKSPRKTKKQA